MNSLVLSYCAQEVKRNDYDRFLAALFVPQKEREWLMALLAFQLELAHVHDAVREEMIGHIRYAWWQEALDALYQGTPRHGHPVLEALHVPVEAGYLPRETTLQPLLDAYRSHFPALPPDPEALLDAAVLTLLQSACPSAETPWKNAQTAIARHRARYGARRNGWLQLKLLVG